MERHHETPEAIGSPHRDFEPKPLASSTAEKETIASEHQNPNHQLRTRIAEWSIGSGVLLGALYFLGTSFHASYFRRLGLPANELALSPPEYFLLGFQSVALPLLGVALGTWPGWILLVIITATIVGIAAWAARTLKQRSADKPSTQDAGKAEHVAVAWHWVLLAVLVLLVLAVDSRLVARSAYVRWESLVGDIAFVTFVGAVVVFLHIFINSVRRRLDRNRTLGLRFPNALVTAVVVGQFAFRTLEVILVAFLASGYAGAAGALQADRALCDKIGHTEVVFSGSSDPKIPNEKWMFLVAHQNGIYYVRQYDHVQNLSSNVTHVPEGTVTSAHTFLVWAAPEANDPAACALANAERLVGEPNPVPTSPATG